VGENVLLLLGANVLPIMEELLTGTNVLVRTGEIVLLLLETDVILIIDVLTRSDVPIRMDRISKIEELLTRTEVLVRRWKNELLMAGEIVTIEVGINVLLVNGDDALSSVDDDVVYGGSKNADALANEAVVRSGVADGEGGTIQFSCTG